MSETPIAALAGFTVNEDGTITISILVDGQVGETTIPRDEVLRLRDHLNTLVDP